jgi:outer membrane protein W
LMTSVFRVIAEGSTVDPDLKVKGLGPFGLKGQFMVTDNIGIGLDCYYANSSFSYSNSGTDSLGNATTYHYKLINHRPRFLLRMDYHINASEKVDPYFGFGLGYSAARYSFETDDPAFDLATYYDLRTLIPVAYRVAFGCKIYFTKFLGAGAEVAIGGPLFTFGVSSKF